MKKIEVGILGATGAVGQQYIKLLENHPWFEVKILVSSEKSAGKRYKDAVANRLYQKTPAANKFDNIVIDSINDLEKIAKNCQFVFSALPSAAAKAHEEIIAKAGLPVISNASYHRNTSDVPVLIPEINHEHLKVIHDQRKKRNWDKGFIVVKPNCSIQSYMIPLDVLEKKFGIKRVFVSTMQAISGAGYPGVSSLDIHDNIVPFIQGEELKTEQEPLKIWGSVENGSISLNKNIKISAHCNRVPVLDGHTACISVEFEKKPDEQEVIHLWDSYRSLPSQMHLPSAPTKTIFYFHEDNRPQPRLDRLNGNGMSISVGRLRPCPLFHYRFVALSHNTIRGAAGGGILNAELLHKMGYL